MHVQTEDVIGMPDIESLCMIGWIVDNSHSSDMINNLPSLSIIQVVAAIITTVTEMEQFLVQAVKIITSYIAILGIKIVNNYFITTRKLCITLVTPHALELP